MIEFEPAVANGCRMLRGVRVSMRDGVELATTVYLPPEGESFPIVLVRTAYNAAGFYVPWLVEHGIAFVAQDCRGRYASDGDWYPFTSEADDGADTLAWVHAQPWCNGRVGMFGDSYLAATQFSAAIGASELLTTIVPRFMTGDGWKRAYYADGAFSLALTWSWLCFESSARVSDAATLPTFDVARLLRHLPLETLDTASGMEVQSYRDYVRNSSYTELWSDLNTHDRLDRFQLPTLLVGGWYDYYPAEALRMFNGLRGAAGLRNAASSEELRDGHRVVIGPWPHGVSGSTTLGELDFGPNALAENDATNRWLDCLLHDGRPADVLPAPIRIFVMGDNVWRDEYEWPPARATLKSYYLHDAGCLDEVAPDAEQPDRYTYEPDDPVPTTGGNHSVGPYNPGLYELAKPGPYDQRDVESRDDVLVYTTAPLEHDLEVTGPVMARIFAATSAPDTDFVARLTDVYPDGRSMNITEGVIRARFRDGVWGAPKLLSPGEVVEYTIDMHATSNVFRAGHRIRLQITSSNFPLWDRNLNTGEDPATGIDWRPADQTVYHDSNRPSRLTLSCMPRDEEKLR